jgi:gas vesicle protein
MASNTVSVLGGAALGAIAAYLLDPDHGQARRRQIAKNTNEMIANAGDATKSLVGAISQSANQLADQLRSQAASASNGAHTAGDQARREFNSSVQSLIDRAKELASSIASRGQSKADELSNRAKSSVERQTGWQPARTQRTIAGISAGTCGALAIGAGLMFFLDPKRGRVRRAWLQQKMSSWARRSSQSATRYGQQVGNQVKGAVAEAKKAMPEQWSKAAERASNAAGDLAQRAGDQSTNPD